MNTAGSHHVTGCCPAGQDFSLLNISNVALTRDIPVVMLTARGEEEDRVRGLETGAGDYIAPSRFPKGVGGAH